MGDALTGPEKIETSGPSVRLSPFAAEKVLSFLDDEEKDALALRVAVQAGGCAGFRYALFFDDRQLADDEVSSQHGVTVRVDGRSAPYLAGSTVDWKESLSASGFTVDNPNSTGGCACGDSAAF